MFAAVSTSEHGYAVQRIAGGITTCVACVCYTSQQEPHGACLRQFLQMQSVRMQTNDEDADRLNEKGVMGNLMGYSESTLSSSCAS